MPSTSTRTTQFVIVVAAMEMLLGISMYAFPQEFTGPMYAPLRPVLPYLSAALVAGGMVLFILKQHQVSPVIRRAAVLLPAAPLFIMAQSCVAVQGWTGAFLYGATAVSLLAAPWLTAAKDWQDRQDGPSLFGITLGSIEAGIGSLMVLAPGVFGGPSFAPIRAWLVQAGIAGIVGGAGLILPLQGGRWVPALTPARRLVGMVFPLLMVWTSLQASGRIGILTWGAWAAGLAVTRYTPDETGPSQEDSESEPDPFPGQLAVLLHVWSWLPALLMVVLTTAGGPGAVSSPLFANLFVLAVATHNTLAFFVLSRMGTQAQRVFRHLAFLTLALGLVMHTSGPMGYSLLALLVAMPALGARACGRAEARKLLLLAQAAILAGEYIRWKGMGGSLGPMLVQTGVEIVSLFAVSSMGLYVGTSLRKVQQDLATRHRELQGAYLDLQAQEEELAAQQEELQAQNEQLIAQSQALEERKDQLEAALELAHRTDEERSRLVAILEATTDFVAIADAVGRQVYMNRAGRRMLAISENQEAAGSESSLEYAYSTWGRELLQKEAVPAAIRDGVWVGENALLGPGGREIPVSQVLIAHNSPDGELMYLSTIAHDISERKRMEAELRHMADYDPLTDLFNRRRFQEEVTAGGRKGRGALLFVDLDQFKYINDTLGHKAGDELLTSLARVLRHRLRMTDVVARLGGDEFAVLLPEADAAGAQAVASQLLEAIGHNVVMIQGQPVRVTASIGIVLFPDEGTTADELLARADLAMYQAKDQGRNSIALYAPESGQQEKIGSLLTWERRIRAALEGNRLIIYCQPILNLETKSIDWYELLVRMVDEDGTIIAPGDFLDTAERFGLIHAIDREMVRRAIRLIGQLHAAGQRVSLSVNLSGKAFTDSELLPLIREELRATGVDPRLLVLEITETAAISDMFQARQFVDTLKRLGCRFAVDDFGAGFSSFSYLKHLDIDYLKIDGSLIKNLPWSRVDQHLVKAIVEIARGLGKETIAEFVGDAETLRLVSQLGVNGAQGYYIGVPGPWSLILPD